MEARPQPTAGFTLYLEGHDAHQGNVLAHAFISKAGKLIAVLGALERAYLAVPQRKTDFEITGADKVNPTTLTLKPVPKVKNYNPADAFGWSIRQIDLVSKGEAPDRRLDAEIARDLVDLATRQTPDGYKSFWINGYSEAVRFDDKFLANAQRLAHQRTIEESPTGWHVGVSHGSIIGELKTVDDEAGNQEFVVVPRVGPKRVICTFPEHMRHAMGEFLFKIVRVTGKLHYVIDSPFPVYVEMTDITGFPLHVPRRTLSQMRGVFSGYPRQKAALDELINV